MAKTPIIFNSLIVTLLAVTLSSLSVLADEIDYDRTAGGGDTSGSNQVLDSPVPWELFSQPLALSQPVGIQHAFSESGMGNNISQPRGQVLHYQPVGGRTTWIIMDILAWVPLAQLLYLDPHQPYATDSRTPLSFAGPVPQYFMSSGTLHSNSSSSAPPIINPVPEPLSLVLLISLSLVLTTRPAAHNT